MEKDAPSKPTENKPSESVCSHVLIPLLPLIPTSSLPAPTFTLSRLHTNFHVLSSLVSQTNNIHPVSAKDSHHGPLCGQVDTQDTTPTHFRLCTSLHRYGPCGHHLPPRLIECLKPGRADCPGLRIYGSPTTAIHEPECAALRSAPGRVLIVNAFVQSHALPLAAWTAMLSAPVEKYMRYSHAPGVRWPGPGLGQGKRQTTRNL